MTAVRQNRPRPASLTALIEKPKVAFRTQMRPSLPCRKDRLERILAMTEANELVLTRAIHDDFGGRAKRSGRQQAGLVPRGAGLSHRKQRKAGVSSVKTGWHTPLLSALRYRL